MKNFLIVEPNRVIFKGLREMYATILEEMEIHRAEDARQALEIIEENPGDYTAILTRYMIGEHNGIELLKEVDGKFPQIVHRGLMITLVSEIEAQKDLQAKVSDYGAIVIARTDLEAHRLFANQIKG